MAFGLKPSRRIDGSPWNGAVRRCVALASYATPLYVGDCVSLVAAGGDFPPAGYADPNTGAYIPVVNRTGAGARIFGVIVSFDPDRTNLGLQYRPASTERQMLVAVANADTVFEATMDAAANTADIGQLCDINVGAGGSTTTGYSSADLDQATLGVASAQAYIVGVRNDETNAGTITAATGATTTSTVWEVVIAEPQVAISQLAVGI